MNNPIKLKRSIYIGLGGTGIKALLKTKKMFIDNYGEVPPMIQFLGIDTDKSEYDKKEKQEAELVTLTKSEQCRISVEGNPLDYYINHRRELNWLRSPNDGMIGRLDRGAGQVRTNGRLAFVYHIQDIQTAIETAYTNASIHDIINNPKYEIADGPVEIHVIFSIGGGTGCGTFIDLAYLIRKMYTNTVSLYGYAVLPQIFKEMMPNGPQTKRVFPNAYGALQDLDFLMHLSQNDEPITLNWVSQTYTEQDFMRSPTPFDIVYFIDNTNGNLVKYDNIDNLVDVISLALVAASGEVGATNNSIFDNVIQVMNERTLDVNNKRAWVASVGTSDIVFKGDEVANTYEKKVIIRMIQRAVNAKEDGNLLATSWIDNLKIREDKGQDQVIDALCSKTPKLQLEITDKENPDAEVNLYCDSVLRKSRESAEKVLGELTARTTDELSKAVSNYLKSGDSCLTTTMDFLSNVKSQIDIFIGEMETEKKGFEEKTASLEQKKAIAVKSLKEEANKPWIKRSSKRVQEYEEDSIRTTSEFVVNENEIIRRLYAVQFFNAVLEQLKKHIAVVDSISSHMGNLKIQLQRELNEMNAGGRSTVMEVDLSDEIKRSLEIDDATLLFSDLYPFVGDKGFEGITTTEELKEVFSNYAKSLPEYIHWKNKTVTEVLNTLSEDDFSEACRKAMQKAVPLLKIDGKQKSVKGGLTIEQAIAHSYFICVEDHKNSRFMTDKSFKEKIDPNQKIKFVSTGLKDRIIIYRQDFVVPGYAVLGVDKWQRDYNNENASCHFNELIHDRMTKENYSLDPSDLNEEVLALWVQGFIFNLIKYDKEIGNGAYTYFNKRTGKAADLFWVNTGTYYRNEAYQHFCNQSKDALEWFKQELASIKERMGKSQVEELCDIVTYKYNYQLHFSNYEQAGYTEVDLETLKDNMNKRIAEKPTQIRKTKSQEASIALFMQEVEYVANRLKKEI